MSASVQRPEQSVRGQQMNTGRAFLEEERASVPRPQSRNERWHSWNLPEDKRRPWWLQGSRDGDTCRAGERKIEPCTLISDLQKKLKLREVKQLSQADK